MQYNTQLGSFGVPSSSPKCRFHLLLFFAAAQRKVSQRGRKATEIRNIKEDVNLHHLSRFGSGKYYYEIHFSRTLGLAIGLLLFAMQSFGQNIDIQTLKSINLHRNKQFDAATIGVTNSVYPIATIAPVSELAIGYLRRDQHLISGGWQTTAALGINFIATFGIKYAINRPRPYATYPYLDPYQHDADPSFPSGHTSFAFCTATSIFMMYPKWYVGVAAYGWAAGVAYSRMALGMHYPSDVIAGAIIGTGAALLAAKGNEWLKTR